jgi:hypothetical protein
MEIVQVILSSILLALMSTMAISCTINAGGIDWYHPLVYILVVLMVILLRMSIKEYKQSKK